MNLPIQARPVMRNGLTADSQRTQGVLPSDWCLGCCGYNINCKNGCLCDCTSNPPRLCKPD